MLSDEKLESVFNDALVDFKGGSGDSVAAALRAVAEAAVKDAVGGEEPVAEINIGMQPADERGYRLFSATLTNSGKILSGGSYPVYVRPQASAAVPEELIEMADRFGCIAHMYNGMKRSTAERFLDCLGYQDLPIGWESLTLPRLLAMLSASQPETKNAE